MDLCGPMRVASINGKRYVLVIVDDYSLYTWVHFLRTKDETPKDSAPVPTNSSNTPVSSHNAEATSQQHAQQQWNLIPSPTASAADNVPNASSRESYLLILLALLPLSLLFLLLNM
nr:Gag-Pol polyprotein [Tanacetum cinerariifolium]